MSVIPNATRLDRDFPVAPLEQLPILLTLLLILGLATLLRWPTLEFSFIEDDTLLIVENTQVKNPAYLLELLGSDYFHRDDLELPVTGVGYYRPLTKISFLLDSLLHGTRAYGFHLTNLLLHLLTLLSLFFLARELRFSPIALALTGLFFAVHPLHSEPIAIITARSDLFLGLTLILALALDLHEKRTGSQTSRIGAILAGAAAMLSKESGVMTPFLLLLSAMLVQRYTFRQALRTVLPHFLVLGAYVLLRFGFLDIGFRATVVWSAEQFGKDLFLFWQNLTYSIVKSFLPIHLPLLNCSAFLVPDPRPHLTSILAALLAPLMVITLIWKLFRQGRWLFLLAFLLTPLLPLVATTAISGQEDLPTFFFEDRWLYPSSAAACLLLGLLADTLLARPRRRILRHLYLGLSLVLLMTWTSMSLTRNTIFENDENLDRIAMNQYRFLAEIFPGDARLRFEAAVATAALLEDGETIPRMEALLQEQPCHLGLLNSLAARHYRRGNFSAAAELYRRSLEPSSGPRPGSILIRDEDYRHRGERHFFLGLSLLRLARIDESAKELRAALRHGYRPGYAELYLGLIAADRGFVVEASAHLERAASVDPTCLDCRRQAGLALARLGVPSAGAILDSVLAEYPKNSPEAAELRSALAIDRTE